MKTHPQIARLGKQLEEARRRHSWTQKDVAQRVAAPASRLSLIEQGKANPTIQTLTEIGEALGLSVILVPTAMLPSVERLIGQPVKPAPLPTEVSSVYDDVFIPDPDENGIVPDNNS